MTWIWEEWISRYGDASVGDFYIVFSLLVVVFGLLMLYSAEIWRHARHGRHGRHAWHGRHGR